MNYNEAFTRWQLLNEAAQLPLPASALAEVLIARAACSPAVSRYNAWRTALGDKATPEALEAEGRRQCPVADRRPAFAAFTEIVAAASDLGVISSTFAGADGVMDATAWLSIFADHLSPD